MPPAVVVADKTVKVALNNGEFYPENIVEGGDLEESDRELPLASSEN